MVIGINGRLLVAGKLDGIGWYTHELLRRIVQSHPEDHFVLVSDKEIDPEFHYGPNLTPLRIGPRARHSFLYDLWYQWSLPRALRKMGAAAFVSLDGFIPLNGKIPTVNVIHDLGFLSYPGQVDRLTAWWYRKRFPQFAAKATRLATVSEFSRADIATRYRIPSDRISVIPNACRDVFHSIPVERQQQTQQRITGGAPYFVFVGVIQPRKNLPSLLKAFDLFKQRQSTPHKLVIAGPRGWKNDEVDRTLAEMNHAADVIFTGYLTDTELGDVVASAAALTMVPHFEGFGVPILEAMACGTPVITSTVTSLPEVTNGAALLVEPNDLESLSAALARIIADPNLAQELSLKGRARSQDYSWDRSAQQLWQLVESVVTSERQ